MECTWIFEDGAELDRDHLVFLRARDGILLDLAEAEVEVDLIHLVVTWMRILFELHYHKTVNIERDFKLGYVGNGYERQITSKFQCS